MIKNDFGFRVIMIVFEFWILDFAGCETKQEKEFDVCNGRFYLANITSVWFEDFDGVFD